MSGSLTSTAQFVMSQSGEAEALNVAIAVEASNALEGESPVSRLPEPCRVPSGGCDVLFGLFSLRLNPNAESMLKLACIAAAFWQ